MESDYLTMGNYAWILLGHIDNPVYSSGTVIIGPTTSRGTVYVAQVAPKDIWEEHVHMEISNNFGGTYFSRPYEWDGTENNDDPL